MMKKFIFFFLLTSKLSIAAHLFYGGRIDYELISNVSFQYKIIVTLYSNSHNVQPVSVDSIYFGDSSSPVSIPLVNYYDLPDSIRINRFEINHTYAGSGTYIIHLEIPNLAADLLNVPHSVSVPLYLESTLVINPFLCPFSSPHLLTTPIFDCPLNFEFTASHGAYDSNWDSLSYELDPFTSTPGYSLPPGAVTINPINGEFKWDNHLIPLPGNYYLSMRTKKWHQGVFAGSIMENFPIKVYSTNDTIFGFNTSSYPPGNLSHILPGNNFNLHVEYFDSSAAPSVQFNSEFFNPSMFTGTAASHIYSGDFTWTPTINEVRRAPYLLQFRGSPGAIDLSYLVYVDGIPIDSCRPFVGVDEINFKEDPFELFPNPAVNSINIKMSKNYKKAKLYVLDITGKIVYQIKVIEVNKLEVNVGSFSPGVYSLIIISEDFITSKKFIVLKQ